MLTYAAKAIVQILQGTSVDDELLRCCQNDLESRTLWKRNAPHWNAFDFMMRLRHALSLEFF